MWKGETRWSNAAGLFLAEQESLAKPCLSSDPFVASLILELSALAAASDSTLTLELSEFVRGVSVLNHFYQGSSGFNSFEILKTQFLTLTGATVALG